MVPVPSQNDMGVVPELGIGHGSHSTSDASGVGRGARVTRYREKKRSRLLSKTIRYEVRKVNADSRPRIKVSNHPASVFSIENASSWSLNMTELFP